MLTASPNTPSPTPDARSLVDAALMGSPTAFERLVERYHSMVYLIGYARLGNHESAEDLAQEVFLRVFLHLRQFDRRCDFAPWIGRIARNLATDWQRRGQSASRLVKMVPLDDAGGQKLPDERAQGAREKMESEERDAAVRQAVFALPPDQRELVLLHYAEELSQQDIAARLGVHPATVSRQMRKAMQALRQSIEPVLLDWVWSNRPQKQSAARTLALIGATAALSAQAKSAVAAAATITQYAASAKTGAAVGIAATAGAPAVVSGLASFIASLGAWIAGGVKVMAIGKIAVVGSAIVVGGLLYQYQHEAKNPKSSKAAKQETQSSAATSKVQGNARIKFGEIAVLVIGKDSIVLMQPSLQDPDNKMVLISLAKIIVPEPKIREAGRLAEQHKSYGMDKVKMDLESQFGAKIAGMPRFICNSGESVSVSIGAIDQQEMYELKPLIENDSSVEIDYMFKGLSGKS